MPANLEQQDRKQERARRLRLLRETAKLTREALAKLCEDVAEGTIRNWETARVGGLTENGAEKVIVALKKKGVDCSLEWLLYGKGQSPIETFMLADYTSPIETFESILAKELQLFHQLNSNSVDVIVGDDGMWPCLLVGDHVAGRKYYDKDISSAIGVPCIVQTLSGNFLVRQVEHGTLEGHFSLRCTNPTAMVAEPVIENIRLFYAAPILWIRRKGYR